MRPFSRHALDQLDPGMCLSSSANGRSRWHCLTQGSKKFACNVRFEDAQGGSLSWAERHLPGLPAAPLDRGRATKTGKVMLVLAAPKMPHLAKDHARDNRPDASNVEQRRRNYSQQSGQLVFEFFKLRPKHLDDAFKD